MGLTGSTIRIRGQPDSIQFIHPNWRLDVDDLHEKSAMFEWNILVSVHSMAPYCKYEVRYEKQDPSKGCQHPHSSFPQIYRVCVSMCRCVLALHNFHPPHFLPAFSFPSRKSAITARSFSFEIIGHCGTTAQISKTMDYP
jgi:hypothetical protein